jgi:hypothetical protein
MGNEKYGAQLNVQIPPELKKSVERLALENSATVKLIVSRALINYLQLHGIKYE